jgi:hypothetical protein
MTAPTTKSAREKARDELVDRVLMKLANQTTLPESASFDYARTVIAAAIEAARADMAEQAARLVEQRLIRFVEVDKVMTRAEEKARIAAEIRALAQGERK